LEQNKKEKAEMLDRRQFFAASLFAATALGAAPRFSNSLRAQGFPSEDVYFDPDIPVLGNPNGDVTIAEFFDYQCPYCKKNHPELKKVVASDRKIRLVMKDFPIFGKPSVYAANLVLASAADGKYATAHDALMNTPGRLSREDVDAVLKKAGLDPTDLYSKYKKNRSHIDGIILRNMAQANAFNLQGTPAFVIGRKIYPGYMNEKALKEAVAEARKS
jgi:protein-disulfide isomerase